MKKVKFAIIALLGFMAGVAQAQKLAAEKVPAAVKTSFAKEYPGVSKVSWEVEKGKYEAGFHKDGHTMSALFEPNGSMTESEMQIKVSELPAAVLASLKAKHPNAKITEAAKITKANGEVNYEAEVKGKDLIFDSKGNLIP